MCVSKYGPGAQWLGSWRGKKCEPQECVPQWLVADPSCLRGQLGSESNCELGCPEIIY